MRKDERTKMEAVRAEVAPSTSRSVKSVFNAAHRSAAVKIAAWSLALGLASCSPATLNAQETVKPPKDKPAPTAVEKKVTYETIADLSELQPYLDAAKDKVVKIEKLAEYVYTDSFVILPGKFGAGTNFRIFVRDDSKPDRLGQELRTVSAGKLENVTIIETNVGDGHPLIGGKMLILAESDAVSFAYFDKKQNRYVINGTWLGDGKMRRGPVQAGYGLNDDGSLFVLSMPRNILPGDVIAQGDVATDSSVGIAFFIYAPDKPSGTLVASIAMR